MAANLSGLSDDVLIARAREGNERAFEALVKRYQQMVYGFSYKVCRDKEKAEETLQDTFVNVYTHLGDFRGSSKFSTWLYSIVTNNCLMKRRSRKIDALMDSLDEQPPGDGEHRAVHVPAWHETPEKMLMNAELRQRLDAAIQKLPIDYRVVFVLRDMEQQSAEDTAKILKLTVPAVKSRLRRARVFLREQLAEFMTD